MIRKKLSNKPTLDLLNILTTVRTRNYVIIQSNKLTLLLEKVLKVSNNEKGDSQWLLI